MDEKKNYILSILRSFLPKISEASKKENLEASIKWLEDIECNGEENTEAAEFLNRLKEMEIPVSQKEIDDLEGEIEGVVTQLRALNTEYQLCISNSDAYGLEKLKFQCNELRQSLSQSQFDLNRKHRRVKVFRDKVYLTRKSKDVAETSGISLTAAKETVKDYPEYHKLCEMEEQLITVRDYAEQVNKNMDSLHTDIRQSSALYRKSIPDV